MSQRTAHLTVSALALALSASVQAQEIVTQNAWGGAGLLQTPVARMEEEGKLSVTASYTSPYARYNVSMQPFPWLEGTFRYISINNRRYGRPELSGDQHYKDKSIDAKIRLFPETRHFPELAFGMRDLGGTGLFSSEFIVASKRFGDLDVSLGAATGYIGNRGDFSNPLRLIDDRFETRPATSGAGSVNSNAIFRGPVGVFGGVSWRSPVDGLILKVELDGNDYQSEPRNVPQRQSSPINIGVVYRVNPNVQLTAAFERGTEAAIGIAFTGNLKSARPVSFQANGNEHSAAAAERSASAMDEDTFESEDASKNVRSEDAWHSLAQRLSHDAGISVSRITRRDREIIVHGTHNRYFYPAQGVGRGARVLDDALGRDIDWFTFAHERVGMPIAETSVERNAFTAYVDHRIDLDTLARKVEIAPPGSQRREEVYRAPFNRFRATISPGYKQVVGGPDGFILYQLTADLSGTAWLNRNTWLTGIVSVDLLNNFDKFRYDAPTRLPRVRTWQRQFLTTSEVMMPNLQLTTAHQLGQDWYGMAYAGYLEYMYGGVGGELLYRPFGQRWAVGLDVNHVRQRDFDQHAGFRDYEISTGHITGYVTLGRAERIQASVSAGKYLAGDIGSTVSVARRFDNGVTMGAYATKTNISSRTFGEGSFDKGIYFSVPMELLIPRPSRARASIMWQPLFRDGGAKLFRRYSLYNFTSERDGEFLLDNLNTIEN